MTRYEGEKPRGNEGDASRQVGVGEREPALPTLRGRMLDPSVCGALKWSPPHQMTFRTIPHSRNADKKCGGFKGIYGHLEGY